MRQKDIAKHGSMQKDNVKYGIVQKYTDKHSIMLKDNGKYGMRQKDSEKLKQLRRGRQYCRKISHLKGQSNEILDPQFFS